MFDKKKYDNYHFLVIYFYVYLPIIRITDKFDCIYIQGCASPFVPFCSQYLLDELNHLFLSFFGKTTQVIICIKN